MQLMYITVVEIKSKKSVIEGDVVSFLWRILRRGCEQTDVQGHVDRKRGIDSWNQCYYFFLFQFYPIR